MLHFIILETQNQSLQEIMVPWNFLGESTTLKILNPYTYQISYFCFRRSDDIKYPLVHYLALVLSLKD